MWKPFSYFRRPDINEQNTGHLSYQRSLNYTLAGYTGGAGFHVLRSMAATQPATIVPGNSLKLNDPSVTGNVPATLNLNPLSDPNSLNSDASSGMLGAQF